jgi:hypothetical protein
MVQREVAALACTVCGGPLGFRYDDSGVQWDDRFRSMWRYWRLLPLDSPDDITG